MKKQIFGLMALILCACAGLTACSDDDNDDIKSGIVGLWQETHCIDWTEGYDGQYNPEAWEEESDARVEFKENGTAVFHEYYNGIWNYEGEVSYKISGNNILFDDNYAGPETTTIDELTNSTLIVTEKGNDDGRTFIVRTKFARIG